MKKANSYPVVLIHGFAGYGEEQKLSKLFPYYGLSRKKDAQKYIKSLGFDCCVPSMGPFSSAWDRACELYAQIFGGTVDYGKVHSEKNGHARFGRTYEAMLPQIGTKDKHGDIIKMHLIAHSYGGPTSRTFIELMANGSKSERLGTPKDELSDLFKGGKADLIHSETTLAANHEGISVIKTLGPAKALIAKALYSAFSYIGDSKINKYYDVRLDQWGISKIYSGKSNYQVQSGEVKNLLKHGDDMGFYGLGTKYVQKLTKNFKTFDNIYYFSYAGCRTFKVPILGISLPKKNMMPLCASSAIMEGLTLNRKWRPSDGMVNLISARAPFNEKQAFYHGNKKIQKGVWYKMPVEDKDHISYMGFGETKKDYEKFFYEIMDRVSDLK